jgi:RNA polymerase sigma factor (sigma-70 family)
MRYGPNELMPTRVSLLQRLKRWDDQESWHDFFRTYWKLIYLAAIRSGLNDSEAQDVVQETVVAVAKKMESFRYDPAVDSFKGWLLYVTRKRIAMQFRQRERDRGKKAGDSETGQSPPKGKEVPDGAAFCPEEIWEQEWERNILETALARVKEKVSAKQFQMFDLYVTKEWPVKEVASTLGVPVAQVYLAKHRIVALAKEEARRLEKQMF